MSRSRSLHLWKLSRERNSTFSLALLDKCKEVTQKEVTNTEVASLLIIKFYIKFSKKNIKNKFARNLLFLFIA